VSAKLVVADGIETTNATHREGDTIILMEMVFAEIVKNPAGLQALQKMEDAKRADMQKALANVPGVKVETKEKVEVTVKLH
jgi:hypothetical protein